MRQIQPVCHITFRFRWSILLLTTLRIQDTTVITKGFVISVLLWVKERVAIIERKRLHLRLKSISFYVWASFRNVCYRLPTQIVFWGEFTVNLSIKHSVSWREKTVMFIVDALQLCQTECKERIQKITVWFLKNSAENKYFVNNNGSPQ